MSKTEHLQKMYYIYSGVFKTLLVLYIGFALLKFNLWYILGAIVLYLIIMPLDTIFTLMIEIITKEGENINDHKTK